MINSSNKSVSCRQITEKVDKSFCRGNFFFVSCGESFFGQGSEEMSREYACKVSRLCHFRTWSFFQKKVSQRWWTDNLLPRSLSLAALLRITCCCYGFMACPRDSMEIQLLKAQKVGHLSLSPRCGPVHDWDVDVHISRKSVFLPSKALVTSFLTISFYAILRSSLLSAKRKKFSFFQSQIKLQPFFFPHVKNESIRRTASYEKSSSKILLLVAVAL